LALLGGLIKNKEERIEKKMGKGMDAIKMKDWNGAMKYFDGLISKGNASPEVFVLKKMLELRRNIDSPKALDDAIALFEKNKGMVVEYGAHTVDIDKLCYECKLHKEDILISNREDATPEKDGQDLVRLGQKYCDLDYPALIMNDIFKEEKMSPSQVGNFIQGQGFKTIANAVKYDDPKDAAKNMNRAKQFYSEGNFESNVKECDEFIANASKSGKCWFCGREETGLYMRLWPMPTVLNKEWFAKEGSLNPDNDGAENVYACGGCRFVFDRQYRKCLQESKDYTNTKVQDLADWTTGRLNELQSQINSLDRRISALR